MSSPLAQRSPRAGTLAPQLPAALALLPAAASSSLSMSARWSGRSVLSFTSSNMLPVFDFVGLQQYQRLFNTERFVAVRGGTSWCSAFFSLPVRW